MFFHPQFLNLYKVTNYQPKHYDHWTMNSDNNSKEKTQANGDIFEAYSIIDSTYAE